MKLSDVDYLNDAGDIYQKAAQVHGKDKVSPPSCLYCSSSTGYFRIKKNSKYSKAIAIVLGLTSIPYFQLDGHSYFPVTHCLRCSGAYDGTIFGIDQAKAKSNHLDFIKAKITENEFITYRDSFIAGFDKKKAKLENELKNKEETPKQKASRYISGVSLPLEETPHPLHANLPGDFLGGV